MCFYDLNGLQLAVSRVPAESHVTDQRKYGCYYTPYYKLLFPGEIQLCQKH